MTMLRHSLLAALLFPAMSVAQDSKTTAEPTLDLLEIVAKPSSELEDAARRYDADRGSLNRTYFVAYSPARIARMTRFYLSWKEALDKLDAAKLTPEGRGDYQRLTESVARELEALRVLTRQLQEIAPLLPFRTSICELEESRRKMERVDSARAATLVNEIRKHINKAREPLVIAMKSDASGAGLRVSKAQAIAAAEATSSLRSSLRIWFNFYYQYDPVFTWWMAEPHKDAEAALQEYATYLREKIATKAPDIKPPAGEPRPTYLAVTGPLDDAPDLTVLMASPRSVMKPVIQRYFSERGGAGGRMTRLPGPVNVARSPEGAERARKLQIEWLAALKKLDFARFSQDAKIDYLLLRHHIERELKRIDAQAGNRDEVLKLLPFEASVNALAERVTRKEKTESVKAVELMKALRETAENARQLVEKQAPKLETAAGAARMIPGMKATLIEWFDDSSKDDEQWPKAVKESYREALDAVDKYVTLLREKATPPSRRDASNIEGRPIGRDALLAELQAEMIPYTPEELMAIAEQEYQWCESEMKKASRDMGFGDNWRKAVEKVKSLHVEPGRQPDVIRDLSREAVEYLNRHKLVTVPPLADETWRADMMSPQRQLVSPFFTGGEVITIAFPTNTMSHDAKMQSLRGNNVHFSRATVHHELIPGHHLQGFMTARYKPYRLPFGTSFWTEGGALYWEFVLYDMGFPRLPEDKIGFLFWRMHRCARVVFSLGFHLGTMTPAQCIDYLIARVGHERDNATAEVRRSFTGGYGPLYQLSYMMGGLQIRALRRELVDSGKMPEREFHDALLKEGRIPIAMIRATLTRQPLTPDSTIDWKFYGPTPAKFPSRSETP